MKKEITINDFSPHLFWDVDISLFNLEENKEQLIFKVLEYGTIQDWRLLKNLYGLNVIKLVSMNLRTLDAVTLSFLVTLFKTDKTEFRCYKHKQLVQNYWNS